MRIFLKRFLLISAVMLAGIIATWLYNGTVTYLDRPLFLSDKVETIEISHVDWMCNCANFIESKNLLDKSAMDADDDDFFFIEPVSREVDWNRDYFIENDRIRVTGRFYIDEGIPSQFELGFMEDKPDHARIFRYDSIEYLTP